MSILKLCTDNLTEMHIKKLGTGIKLTQTKKIVTFWPAPENSIEGIRARKTQLSSIKCEVRRRR